MPHPLIRNQLEATAETLNTLILTEEDHIIDASTPPASSSIQKTAKVSQRDVIIAKYPDANHAKSLSKRKVGAGIGTHNPDLINLISPKQVNHEIKEISRRQRSPANFKQLSPQRDHHERMDDTLENEINESGIYVQSILPPNQHKINAVFASQGQLAIINNPVVTIENRARLNSSKLRRESGTEKEMSPKQLKKANE